jgi:hypothetical protein
VEAITEDVMQIIARELKIPLDHLAQHTALQDLGLESLDLIENPSLLRKSSTSASPITQTRRQPPTVRPPCRADWESLKRLSRFPRR